MNKQRLADVSEGSDSYFHLPRAIWRCVLEALEFFIPFDPESLFMEIYFKEIVIEMAKI